MKSHGEMSCQWQGDLLILNATGPFNLEGIEDCAKQLRNTIEMAPHNSWLRLDLPNNDTLGEPEVMASFGRYYLWGFNHGCRALAVVCTNLLQRSLCESFSEAHQINFQVFDNKCEALAWLRTQ